MNVKTCKLLYLILSPQPLRVNDYALSMEDIYKEDTGLYVSVSQWRRLLPAFSAPSGLCCRSFPCLTERWTELESENEPPRKRKRLSLRRKENKPITGDGGRRVGAPSGSLSFGCSGDASS